MLIDLRDSPAWPREASGLAVVLGAAMVFSVFRNHRTGAAPPHVAAPPGPGRPYYAQQPLPLYTT
ncbi:hypothetical protein [Streptomyces wuyuanensis]|uniref:hypothetical protein n=1 Tax=Streptomyces wuyuanensis TaxID=1196353 RepID=UPI003D71F178